MQRIDDRLVKKVNELVKDGVTSVAEMERHLQSVAIKSTWHAEWNNIT